MFVSQGTPERIYLLKLYLNIDRRIGFLLHPRFHRIMFNSETNRERHARFPSVHVERITGSLTPAGLSSINLARSNAPRCVKYDYYSAPKMSQLVEPSSTVTRLSRTIVARHEFHRIVFPTNLLQRFIKLDAFIFY